MSRAPEPLNESALAVELEAANGKRMTMREYLNRAIKAFGLREGAYEEAFEHLNRIASEQDEASD